MAEQFARRTGIGFVGLRISNIMQPDDYARFPTFWDDPTLRKWNLWGYVDARDVATAARLGLEADIAGSEICIVAAADTVMPRPSTELMAEIYPAVPLGREVRERETLLAIDRARTCSGTSRPTAGRTTSPRRATGRPSGLQATHARHELPGPRGVAPVGIAVHAYEYGSSTRRTWISRPAMNRTSIASESTFGTTSASPVALNTAR